MPEDKIVSHAKVSIIGIGRDNSYHALDTYLQIKSTWIKLEDK